MHIRDYCAQRTGLIPSPLTLKAQSHPASGAVPPPIRGRLGGGMGRQILPLRPDRRIALRQIDRIDIVQPDIGNVAFAAQGHGDI